MAFSFSAGATAGVNIDTQDEALFTLPGQLGVSCPLLDRVWEHFYADPVVTAAELQRFRDELANLRAVYFAKCKTEAQHAKKVHAKDPRVLHAILNQLVADEPLLNKLNELVDLCDAAIEEGSALFGSSD